MQHRQLPKFLNANHIQSILQISYAEASNLLDNNICPVFIIGNTRRIMAKDFHIWLKQKK